MLFAQDLGVAKPDLAAYEIAAEKVDRTPGAMIGDSLPNDVTGPQAAGWTGIWLKPERLPVPAARAPAGCRSHDPARASQGAGCALSVLVRTR
ncbi:hypothetical protein GCM10028799_24920 [Kribbella italica]